MLARGIRIGFLMSAAVWLTTSCAVTRHVPEDRYLLNRNIIKTDRDAPRTERIKADELEEFIRQRPNKRLLGMRIPLWFYNIGNPDKNTWWSRAWRRIGEAPVVFDTTFVKRSSDNMEAYMRSRGFFDATQSWAVDTARRGVTVTFKSAQGRPYHIARIRYDFQDRFLRPVVMQDSTKTLLHTGDIFDLNVLDRERMRITENLRRQGYYNFTINHINFLADSTVGGRRVNLTMVVRQNVSGFDLQGMPEYDNNMIYRLRNIYINPDHNPTRTDSLAGQRPDTLEYMGLSVIHEGQPRVRESILRRVVNLYANDLYNADEVRKAYDNIMRMGYFRSASILFTEIPDTSGRNLVTFIGADDRQSGEHTTEQGYLDCTILCTPALRHSYKVEFEATTTSNYYGLTTTLGYQNRNLFRGAELFDVSVRGGYEFMRAKIPNRTSSFEIGGSVSLSLPRFVAPLRIDPFGRVSNPRTKIELSINSQRRPNYHRVLSGASWGYSWGNGRHSTYTLRPIDLSLVHMGYLNPAFERDLEAGNPYLLNSYISQLIPGISGSYVYNNQISRINRDVLAWRVNWETAGNLFSLLSRLSGSPVAVDNGREYYKLLGIRYAQYARADVSMSYKFVLDPRNSIVYRLYAGFGVSYGNSASLPFDRMFFAGGSNSMRGWPARTLGPGAEPESARMNTTYPSQLGSMKLETNLEYRFPVWDFLNGAIFFDAGNIWFMDPANATREEAVFRFRNFVSQLGLNTGLGARFDFSFFVVRADWGIRLHDPNRDPGDRWISGFRFRNTAINFGVGYPF